MSYTFCFCFLSGHGANKCLWATAKNPLSFVLTIPGVVFMLVCLIDGFLPNEFALGVYLIFASQGPSIMILNYKLLTMLLQCFQVWFLFIMSLLFTITWFSELRDIRFVALPCVLAGVMFSIVVDAYPGSGRFLAGVRFYSIKLTLAASVIMVFVFTSKPEKYFQVDVGEITFSGGAIVVGSAMNLFVFGMRNLYQLFKEPDCLVVLSCLVEFGDGDEGCKIVVPEDELKDDQDVSDGVSFGDSSVGN